MSFRPHLRDLPTIRRRAVLWALLALLGPAFGAHADQQTPPYNLTFSTQGQKIWGTDAFQNFSYDQYYRQSWDNSGSAGGYDDPCVDLGWPLGNSCLGDFGAS